MFVLPVELENEPAVQLLYMDEPSGQYAPRGHMSPKSVPFDDFKRTGVDVFEPYRMNHKFNQKYISINNEYAPNVGV